MQIRKKPLFYSRLFSIIFHFIFFSNPRKFIAKKEIVYQKKSRIITTFGHQIPGKDVENTDSVQLNPDEQGLAKSGSSDISAFAINNSENNLKSEIFLLDSIFTVNFRNWVTKI